MQYPIVFGIDLGNTNTSIAYRVFDPNNKSTLPNLVCLDPDADGIQPTVMPSAVLYRTPDGEALVGRKARAAALDKGMLFINFKETLLKETPPETRTEKGIKKSAVDALTDLLSHALKQTAGTTDIISYFKAGLNGNRIPNSPFHLTLGVPTETSETYRNHLKNALVASGWFPSLEAMNNMVSFIAEPVAVVLNVPAKDRHSFTVYDHGGLTLDIAQIIADESSTSKYTVKTKQRIVSQVGKSSVNVGGSFCDRLLLKFLVQREGGLEAIWQSIGDAYGAENCNHRELATLVEMKQEPKGETYERKLYDRLCSDIELVRIKLSDQTTATVWWNARTPAERKSNLTLSEDELVDEVLSEISHSITAQLPPDSEDASTHILAGGVSMTPFLTAAYNKLYPGKTQRLADVSPLTAIARGLASYYQGGVGTDDTKLGDKTDNSYGIYNDQDGRWEVVLETGTQFITTKLPNEGLPPEGAGVSKSFKAYPATNNIAIRVGECVKGEWRDVGNRDILLPTAATRFLIYFQADQSGILEIRLADKVNRKLIHVENPKFRTLQ